MSEHIQAKNNRVFFLRKDYFCNNDTSFEWSYFKNAL